MNEIVEEINFDYVLERNEFTESDENAVKELKEIDRLYSIVTNLLEKELEENNTNRPNRLGTNAATNRKNTRFISDLVANLTNIKNLRLNVEKSRVDNKKNYLDRMTKIVIERIKAKENINNGKENNNELLDFVLKNTNLKLNASLESKTSKEEEFLIENELNLALNSFEEIPKQISSKNKKLRKYYDCDNNFLVYSITDDKVFLVNEAYEIIKEINEDLIEVENEGEVYYDANTKCIIEIVGN